MGKDFSSIYYISELESNYFDFRNINKIKYLCKLFIVIFRVKWKINLEKVF